MKKTYLMLALAVAGGAANAQNLVTNGGAESFNATTLAATGWTVVSGSWTSQLPGGFVDTAYEGARIFWEGSDSLGTLQQDVNVSAYSGAIDSLRGGFQFFVAEQSFSQGEPDDEGIYTIQCLNAAKTSVLYSFSDTLDNASVWGPNQFDFDAPAGTRYIRIRLTSLRYVGSDNDGYFDDVRLMPDIHPFTTGIRSATSPLAVAVYPNPAHDLLSFSAKTEGAGIAALTDLSGREVLRSEVADLRQGSLNIGTLQAGTYFLKVTTVKGSLTSTAAVIKQ